MKSKEKKKWKKMDCKHYTRRMEVERDRLSNLPDDVIHKILSFVSIKLVVGTSVLSSRWRFIWKSMRFLNFSSEDFPSLPEFSKVVSHVLSTRNDQIDVVSFKLCLHGRVSQAFVKRVLDYVFAHNVQDMTVVCEIEEKIVLPLSLFCSQTLKHLTLIGSVNHLVASTWELPALTTLHLGYVTLYDDADDDYNYDYGFVNEDDDEDDDDDDNDDHVDILSKCPNLKSITLDGCKVMGSNGLGIFHPQLSSLTLKNGDWRREFFHVVAPQLKNLIIVDCDWVQLSAPNLTSFIYRSGFSLEFSTDSLPYLEEVDLCISSPFKTEAHGIAGLLQKFYSVKSLTLNLETIELLSSSVELISNQPSSFANLGSLKIYPAKIHLEGKAQKNVGISNEVKNYFLEGSLSASFTLVTREEIKAESATLARHLMAELWVMLEQDNAKINWDQLKRGKVPMVCYSETVMEDLEMIRQSEKKKIRDITSKLKRIEKLLTKLPPSNRSKLQSSFPSLCAKANLLIKKIERTCENQESRVSVYFDELAALYPSRS